jgi:hypothetical protein
MKIIVIAMTCLFLSLTVCWAQQDNYVSELTLNNLIQFKQYMDKYTQDAFREAQQYGANRKEYLVQILNYVVVISRKIDLLLSVLDVQYALEKEEYSDELTPQEASKYIDFIIERMDVMTARLNKHLQSVNEAILIHHIESVKRFFGDCKSMLLQVKSELDR